MDLKQRHRVERGFHDAWAAQLSADQIQARQSFESPTAVENRQVLAWSGPLKGRRILDLGCGMGDAAVYFALQGANVTAVDVSAGMVRVCRALAKREGVSSRVRALRGVGEKLPFRDRSFDLVYGNGVLHHLDMAVAAPEIARVLRPGGFGIFIEPLAYNPLIAVYRALASSVRTEAEEPVTYAQLRGMAAHFAGAEWKEMQLLTLAIFLWFYLVERQHPSKVRYWKKIVAEGARYGRAFGLLFGIEQALLRVLPFLKPLCWNVVIRYRKEAR